MPLLINNEVQERILEMADALEVIEGAFAQLARGDAAFEPRRTSILTPDAEPPSKYPDARTFFKWAALRGAIRDPPRFALRFRSDIEYNLPTESGERREKFNGEPGTFMGIVLLFDTRDGTLLAILNDGVLQHARVGATAGVAGNHLSRADSRVMGLLGSGGMAASYAQAFDVVRDLEAIHVFSPTRAHREEFAARMNDTLKATVHAVASPDQAAADADILASCTSAVGPVLDEHWIEPGRFVVNVSGTEVPGGFKRDSEHVYTTTTKGAMTDIAGSDEILDVAQPAQGRTSSGTWHANEELPYPTLPDIVGDDVETPGAESGSVLYLNRSNGVQFPSIAQLLYERARERGLGTEIPLEWFQQGLRT